MKRIALTIAILAFFSNDLRAQARYMGRQNGDAVFVSLPMDKLSRSPDWDIRRAETLEPPISIGKAIRLAKQAVTEKYPNHKEKSWSVSIEFREEQQPINDGHHLLDENGNIYYRDDEILELAVNKWVYWIRLSWSPTVGNGLTLHFSPSIPVAVLIDGTVLVAQKERKVVSEQELKTSYKKLENKP